MFLTIGIILSIFVQRICNNITKDIWLRNIEKYLKVIVTDDGRGFYESDIVNACKPYYHNAPDDNREHYGMGLYICKILCEKHGGDIALSNINTGGACVQVTFYVE